MECSVNIHKVWQHSSQCSYAVLPVLLCFPKKPCSLSLNILASLGVASLQITCVIMRIGI